MKKQLSLFVITLLSVMLIQPMALAQNAQSWSSEFLGRIDQSIGQEWENAGEKLSASIFESITDQEFFKTKVVGELSASLKVQRKVYDNHDILDTWTVIDIMKAPLYLPIPLLSDDMDVMGGAFGAKLALSLSGVAYNIRQVKPAAMNKLLRTTEIEERILEAKELGDQIVEFGKQSSEDDKNLDLDNDDEYGDEDEDDDQGIIDAIKDFAFWNKSNPQMRARYSKIWKLLTHPLSIPLTQKAFQRYPVGDVSSYGVEGSVQVGVSVGWDQFEVAGLDLSNASAGIGISTYLKGDFRISILKEKEDQAIVKLTRVRNKGSAITLGTVKLEHEIFEGFVVLGQNVLNIKEQIIPFSLVFNRNQSDQFDISYRYDFNNPRAVKAYEKAVLGRFKLSESLSLEEGSGVTRATKREQQRNSYTLQNKVKLSLIFESATSSTRAKTKAIITLGDKKHHLFSSENIQYKGYDTLWGTSEAKHHSFITSVVLDNPDRFVPENVSLRIEGRIEDSDTSAKELATYYSEVETALQKEMLFPRPPAYNVKIDCDELQQNLVFSYVKEQCLEEEGKKREEETNYGRTSFYYQLNLNYKQLEIIRETSKKKMWSALEQAYGVKAGNWSSSWKRGLSFLVRSPLTLLNAPLYLANLNIPAGGKFLSAAKFFRAWKDLKKVEDSKEFITAFGKLFRTVHFSAEIVKVVRILTSHESIPYYYTAKAERLWGQMSSSGDTIANPIALITQAEQIINFDYSGPRSSGDPNALVNKINVQQVSRSAIKLSFDLAHTPEYLYFRIDRSPNWGRYKNLMKTMLLNDGRFQKGHNEIIVDIENSTGFLQKLAEHFFNGKYSTLMMSISLEDQNFGPVKSTKFEFEYEPIDPEEMIEGDDKEVVSNQIVVGPQ